MRENLRDASNLYCNCNLRLFCCTGRARAFRGLDHGQVLCFKISSKEKKRERNLGKTKTLLAGGATDRAGASARRRPLSQQGHPAVWLNWQG